MRQRLAESIEDGLLGLFVGAVVAVVALGAFPLWLPPVHPAVWLIRHIGDLGAVVTVMAVRAMTLLPPGLLVGAGLRRPWIGVAAVVGMALVMLRALDGFEAEVFWSMMAVAAMFSAALLAGHAIRVRRIGPRPALPAGERGWHLLVVDLMASMIGLAAIPFWVAVFLSHPRDPVLALEFMVVLTTVAAGLLATRWVLARTMPAPERFTG